MRALLTLTLCCAGCSAGTAGYQAPSAPSLTAAAGHAVVSADAPAGCPREPSAIGRVEDPQLNEISGVVESRSDPRVLFVHNDSGDSPRFFAIDRRGQLLAELRLKGVPLLMDAEDIAIGPGPGGGDFVYLGDTGNNFASFGLGIPRRKAVLYRVAEPNVPFTARGQRIELEDAFRIVLTFPDGARDVEAFFIEPTSGDLFMLSKQADGRSQLLTASAAVLAAGGAELRLLGELRLGQSSVPGSAMATSASISHDGSLILVRTYATVLLFRRAAAEPIASALSRAPELLSAPHEAQGEAIGLVDADAAFITISEGVKPAINCARLAP
jgi:hypothetical protein